MTRQDKTRILVLSHCILNTASKVQAKSSHLVDELQTRKKLLERALADGVQLLQLPCPEFTLYGHRRWGHVKDQFLHPHFIRCCRSMLAPILDQLVEYSSYPDEFELLGIVSVEGSPSCGYKKTCRSELYGGELSCRPIDETMLSVTSSTEPGIFMQVLMEVLEESGLKIPILTMDEALEKLILLS